MLGYMLAGCSKWNLEPKVIPTGGNADYGIFSKGQVEIPILKGYDLDGGSVLADGSAPADFYWNVEQLTKVPRGELYAHNGAKFATTILAQTILQQPRSVLYSLLTQQTYSDNSIATDSSTPIKAGIVIAYQTSDGRYGTFKVDKLGTGTALTLSITWVTLTN
jgi:hypothetical protein